MSSGFIDMAPEVLAVIGIGMVAAVFAVVLRQIRPEYALFVSLAAGVFIVFKVFGGLVPVVAQIETILDMTALPREYTEILFKSLGICFLTQLACDVCKDAGESAIATKIEMAGRIGILAVSLPLFTRALSIVSGLTR